MVEARRTMLLTGASRGIGHATVKLFYEQGWRVLSVSRAAFSEHCPWPGGEDDHIQGDLSDPSGYDDVVGKVRERLGGSGLAALVNNAGISPKDENGGRLGVSTTDYATWLRVFNVNLFASAILSRELLPELRAATGSIVNVTSIAGSRVHPFAGSAYACSKAALATLTREQAFDFGRFGVRVNAIAPGEIETDILSDGTAALVRDTVPMGRLGDPREIASTIMFLCSSVSSYINGAEIRVDGGQYV